MNKLKYIPGDIIRYKDILYVVEVIKKDQYSLLTKDTGVATQRKGWKVDKDAIPISLVTRPKPIVQKSITIWDKLKFW